MARGAQTPFRGFTGSHREPPPRRDKHMSSDRGVLRCGLSGSLVRGLGVSLAALLAGCSAESQHTAPAMPFVTNSAAAVRHAGKPRFLHEYPLPMGTYPISIIAGPDGA